MRITYMFLIEADGKRLHMRRTHWGNYERLMRYVEMEMFYNNYKDWKILKHYKLN